MNHFKLCLNTCRSDTILLCQQRLDWAQHERKGCAKFVAHIAEEQSLCTIDFGQGVHSPAFVFICPRIRDSCCDLSPNELEEATIERIESKPRTNSRNQHSGWLVFLAGTNRQYDSAVRWLRPGSPRQTLKSLPQMVYDSHLLRPKRVPECPTMGLVRGGIEC